MVLLPSLLIAKTLDLPPSPFIRVVEVTRTKANCAPVFCVQRPQPVHLLSRQRRLLPCEVTQNRKGRTRKLGQRVEGNRVYCIADDIDGEEKLHNDKEEG